MLTEKDYCDYDTSRELKELGFNSLVDWYFKEDKSIASSLARYRNTYIPRISLYEAQKWLREERGIIVYPMSIGDLQHQKWYAKIEYMDFYSYPIHDTYEDALVEGLRAAVKILKEK